MYRIFKVILCWVLVLYSSFLVAQNIYDYENGKKYANYLYDSDNFKEAAKEFIRISKLISNNDSVKLAGIRCYRKAKLYDTALFYLDGAQADSLYKKEYISVLLLKRDFTRLSQVIQNDLILSENEHQLAKLHLYMLNAEWKNSEIQLEYVKIVPFERILAYNQLITEAKAAKRKSAFLAFTLSLIVPGLGKVYAGAPWEGVSSFMVVGLLGFSSFRGFYGVGERSVPGWLFGSAATGFYVGNLYGSVKQAKKYNARVMKKYNEYAENLIFLD